MKMSPSTLTFNEFLLLPLKEQLLLTADYVDEFISLGGIIYWNGNSGSQYKLCPAEVVLSKFIGYEIIYPIGTWDKVNHISDFVYIPNNKIGNYECLDTGDKIREKTNKL